ncbi:hypothetical protein A1D31_24265 [Bradyrhizobium liaoningense]|nr:hypothetical protein A1D31_24265 [Bradyrhizobium liaoningense]
MQLGRRVFGDAHYAEKALRTVGDLKAISVDQGDSSVCGNQYSALIDVANDAARSMHLGKDPSDIERYTHDEAIVSLRKMPLS